MSYITAGGLKLWVTDTGAGDQGAVLLLHGLPDTSSVWKAQVVALSGAGYRVIAPDLPGLGNSPGPQQLAQYSLASSVAPAMLALLDALGVPKAAVVGHDLGTIVAWAMAEAAPARITSLVSMCMGYQGSFFAADPMVQRAASWHIPTTLLPGSDAAWSADNFRLFWDFYQLNSTSEQQLVEYLFRMSQPGGLTSALNLVRANYSLQEFCDTMPHVASVPLSMPVLGVWATKDAYCLQAQMVASQLSVAQGCWQYEEVNGGHWLMLEQPDAVNQLLLKFLAGKPAAAAKPAPAVASVPPSA